MIESNIIIQDWPNDSLETVTNCPYCGSVQRSLAYESVRDWSFNTAPGAWNYWNCTNCYSLYLDPRPNSQSIGSAYSRYYTHTQKKIGIKQFIKSNVKNECLSHWLNINLLPRIGLPDFMSWLLIPFKFFIRIPFDVNWLSSSIPMKLVDVGCGGGFTGQLASLLGWQVMGIELDPVAAQSARKKGLHVINGDYNELEKYQNEFDCLICSHVLEHVYEPLHMLSLLTSALKDHGVLILSLPNADSDLRHYFGKNWRGLEAPRHLSIPTLNQIITLLKQLGYVDIEQHDIYEYTYLESLRIEKRRSKIPFKDYFFFNIKRFFMGPSFFKNSDCIQIIARKRS